MPTHHDDDHAAGVPHLAAATGAAVVTTDGRGIEPARIVGVHGRAGTLEELRQAVAASQE